MRVCEADEPCDNPGEVSTSGKWLCTKHHHRWIKHGSTLTVLPRNPNHGPRPQLCGAGNPNWAGNAVTYSGMHARVKRSKGRAAEHLCVCGATAQQWAYNGLDPDQLYCDQVLGFYSTNTSYYEAMCVSCHRKLDGRKKTEDLRSYRRLLSDTRLTVDEIRQKLGLVA